MGKTSNLDVRLDDHQAGDGSEWTALHKPISVCEIRRNCDDWDEDKFVKQMMALHGIDKVRGGSYSQTVIHPYMKELLTREIRGATNACFRCGASDHFAVDCDKASCTSSVSRHSHRSKNAKESVVCYKCKGRGHYSNECSYVRPPPPPPPPRPPPPRMQPQPMPSKAQPCAFRRNVVCYTCNRPGHYANVCPGRLNVVCYRCGVRGHYASRCHAGYTIVVFR